MNQPGGGGQGGGRRHRRHRGHRHATPRPQVQPTSLRWSRESGPKICRKCGGRMYPADWIWQQYGLCLGWRCSQCKEKVLARSLPFKGLRKRKPDPDEIRDRLETKGQDAETEGKHQAPHGSLEREAGRQKPERERHRAVQRDEPFGL